MTSYIFILLGCLGICRGTPKSTPKLVSWGIILGDVFQPLKVPHNACHQEKKTHTRSYLELYLQRPNLNTEALDNAKPTEDQTILVTTRRPHDQTVPDIIESN